MGVTVVASGNNLNVVTSQAVVTGSGTVENTDQSYQETVNSGATVIIPDITLTKNDDTTTTAIAAIDLDLGVIDPFPNDWDGFVSAFGRGYEYPNAKGNVSSFRTGDERDIENTIFGATVRQTQTLKARNTLDTTTFLLLNNNNSFGNKNRFTAPDGTQTFTDDLVIDNHTGLMWYRIRTAVDTWNNLIDNALSSTQGGHSDWFLPSLGQLDTICQYENGNPRPTGYAPFSLFTALATSTTDGIATTQLLYLRNASNFNNGTYDSVAKTNAVTAGAILCRKHF